MKRLLYILLALPLLIGCQGKKKATADAMPVPEVSVAHPLVKDITLTKDYGARVKTCVFVCYFAINLCNTHFVRHLQCQRIDQTSY